MDARSAVTPAPPGRRTFWICAALLVPVLPLAVVVHSWSNWHDWQAENRREPIEARAGEKVRYAGAEWRLTRFTRLATEDAARMSVVVEFEAQADDAAAMVQAACTARLVDATGRSWQPVFLTEPAVKKALPEAAARPRCGAPAFTGPSSGGWVKMAESFSVPRSAEGIRLEVALSSTRPATLMFSD